LKAPSHFGRPDFDEILERHFQDVVQAGITEKKIGVFVSYIPLPSSRLLPSPSHC
jgi:hypothetical protein